jgi:hypothetical protein
MCILLTASTFFFLVFFFSAISMGSGYRVGVAGFWIY